MERKATDVLLSIENTVNNMQAQLNALQIAVNLINNRLSDLEKKISVASIPSPPVSTLPVSTPVAPAFKIEAADVKVVEPGAKIPMTTNPEASRRVARPDVYAGDGEYINKTPSNVVLPNPPPSLPAMDSNPAESTPQMHSPVHIVEGSVPVTQRVVDKNNKSIFLLNVKILDKNGDVVAQTRTNGIGKWSAALSPGDYMISYNRPLGKSPAIDLTQKITVEKSSNVKELPILIIK